MLNRKLSVEVDFQLISEELMKIFNSNYLDELARKELFLKRTRKLSPLDFVSLFGFVATGRLEFYFRADGMESWEVARLMGLFEMTAEVDSLLGLVEDITGRSTLQHLPCSHSGFSLSVEPNGVPTVFSLFFVARNLLGGGLSYPQQIA